jgi:hypothetical protein
MEGRSMIIETLIASLVPVAAESIKQIIVKWVGGVKPTTVAEQIQLDQSEVEKLKALAQLDSPIGQPSQWVVDLRASARYIGALSVIAVGIGTLYITGMPILIQQTALEAANIAFGFLFGSRIVAAWKK